MDVLLINPPSTYSLKSELGVVSPPLSLAYLASTIRENGYSVKIVDAIAEDSNLRDLAYVLRREDPDVVGITATTPMIMDAYEVAKLAKTLNPNVTVVVGGPHVTFIPEYTLDECPYIDYIVRSEGEKIFLNLLNALDKNLEPKDVRGITYRSDGVIKSNPPEPLIANLDILPIPAYDLLPLDKYNFNGVRYGTVITSRGCPYRCVFCSSSRLMGGIFRAHSPKRVLQELSILRNEFNVKEIEFLDDTFTLNRRRAREISKRIIEEDLDISWSASSRVNTFDLETGYLMHKAGAHTIYFGLESGTKKILEFIDKKITTDQSKKAVKVAKKIGLNALGSFVIGFPIETRDDIEQTINFAKNVGVDYAQFTIATPYPGTGLWDYALKYNLLLTKNWRRYTAVDVVMKSFYLPPKTIKNYLIKAYVKFYLRLRYIIDDIVKRSGILTFKLIYDIIKTKVLKK